MAPRVGLEPTTFSLTASCSTIELPGNGGVYRLHSGQLVVRAKGLEPPRCPPSKGDDLPISPHPDVSALGLLSGRAS